MKEIILERDNEGNTVIVNDRHYKNVSLASTKRMERFMLCKCARLKITKLRYKNWEYVGIKAEYQKEQNKNSMDSQIKAVCL